MVTTIGVASTTTATSDERCGVTKPPMNVSHDKAQALVHERSTKRSR